MLLIGVDPHKSTHTATAIDPASNQLIATIRIESTLADYRRLLTWARTWPEHTWAVEGASGLGRHLTQWLLARGEHTRRHAAQLAGHTRASPTRLCNALVDLLPARARRGHGGPVRTDRQTRALLVAHQLGERTGDTPTGLPR